MKRIVAIAVIAIAVGLTVFWFLSRSTAIEKEIRKQSWTLVKLKIDGKEASIPEGGEVTFEPMGGDRYVGMAGVNHYETHLRIDGNGGVTFDRGKGGGVTEMAGLPHLMDFETIYIGALWKTQSATVSGSTLVLRGPGVELTYEGRPALPIDTSGSPDDTVSTDNSE